MADLISDAGDNPVNRLLIEAIRGRGLNEDGALLVAQITHWQDLAAAALNARIFPLVYRAVNSHMSPSGQAIFDEIWSSHKQAQSAQLGVIDSISAECDAQGIRFAVVKGLALGEALYAEIDERQAGDIDLLVDSRDLVWMDSVLRGLGFRQPNVVMTQLQDDMALTRYLQAKSLASAPFPMRRKAHSNQLLPYYSKEGDVRVEVHDGLYHIPDCLLKRMLWQTEVSPRGYRRLPPFYTFLNLVLTAYENSENFYATWDGDANLRDYADLRQAMTRWGNALDWDRMRALADENHMCKMFAAVGANYRDVFGEESNVLDSISGKAPKVSMYLGSFYDRVFDRTHARELAACQYRSSLVDLVEGGNVPFADEAGIVVRYDNPYAIDISLRIALAQDVIELSWQVENLTEKDLALLGFKVVLAPCYGGSPIQYCADAFVTRGTVRASCCRKDRITQQFTFNPAYLIEETAYEDRGSSHVINLRLPLEMFEVPSRTSHLWLAICPIVFTKASSTAYHSLRMDEGEFNSVACAIDLSSRLVRPSDAEHDGLLSHGVVELREAGPAAPDFAGERV